MKIYLITFLVFISIYTILILTSEVVMKRRMAVKQRLKQFSKEKAAENAIQEELNKPLRERIVKPFLSSFSQTIEKVLPTKSRDNLKQKLVLAGNPGNLTPNEFVAIRFGLTIALPLIVFVLGKYSGWEISKVGFIMLLAGVMGYGLPEVYLVKKKQKRIDEIEKTLPDILDMLTVSVEAGLGFDAALAKVVEKTDSVLSSELARVLQEMKMGKPRRDALRDLNKRTNVEDLSNFISSVIQADQLGVSVGGVLRLQSKETRQKRRQRAEEKAMKAPVKMVIPLVIFIFPAIFIVLLGPAVLRMIDAFLS